MGDLPVGHLRSGETVVDFQVGIPGRSLASHIGIFATTGMGKSNLLQVLCAGVMAANGRYGLLVIDPHGEHRLYAPTRTGDCRIRPPCASALRSCRSTTCGPRTNGAGLKKKHCTSWSAIIHLPGWRGWPSLPGSRTSPASGTWNCRPEWHSIPSR